MTPALTTQQSAFERTELIRALSAPKGFGDLTLRDRRPDAIELLGGIPAPELLPTTELAEAITRVLEKPGAPALQYGRTEGLPQLRELIAARENVPVERVLITNGGFHGLSLAIHLVVERGGLVAVDNPIFPLFMRGLELSAARIHPITVGELGLDLDELESWLVAGARPVALYTVPDFHNPSQATLPSAQRVRLVQLAERYDFVVFADNPYRELRFTGEPAEVSAFHDSEHVIHINTFTKTLGPGLRLGWVVLPERFVSDAVALRSRQDSHTSLLVQAGIAELLATSEGYFDEVLDRARPVYARRARTLADALEQHAADALSVTVPEGGFFLWPRITDDAIDADQLAADASAEGIEYQRGSFFRSGPDHGSSRHLRLSFGDTPEEKLIEAAKRLARAIDRQRG
ncbi:aminotransferase-like domain-containing protein [Gulosibacter chungangensis]|uniref:PLP-dependent aminotransferase family protein n=1 Tax=Gulosibacter chungangensis TaxID=979746 RepID=A0A7J5BBX9_9MICO|nr:PLP-dependent aminotransferase family protein [Gulosibacter chungangensis]KAB1643650.1 PLP-dependent aminotransferase family protein [Gulosibacter chungangensis]